MSETTPGAARAEAGRTPESREAVDSRARVIGAFNRTMDRMQLERDAIMGRARAQGPGFLTDRDRMIVLSYQYAAEGAKRITGGSERLNNGIENDRLEVEVRDRTTKQIYIKKRRHSNRRLRKIFKLGRKTTKRTRKTG